MHYLSRSICCTFFILLSGTVIAQDEGEEVVEEIDPLEAARAKGGDILIMKSGAIMSGVQILRSTPTHYEVQIAEGVDSIKVNRRLVSSVEYDDIDLRKEKRRRDLFPDVAKELDIDSEELSPMLLRKLKTPLTDDVLNFEKKDY